ncbi:phosphoribosylaminoimidazolesuccinocarboxamide synthase [Thermoactinomyces mirandus]|uniref:Phosphoribosylaminoimidazole-succinocarboxamide synthase n=1 Tax=Thermoactinomyces mirandus TaxID=2756294 RepID=A0A7W2AR02_9BACL|nr:phosphoribosylaminoimidazolesuccinocarboxamide synthase [Thermoactinomyces mirandus]MBA4601056.1 phosphoribosylaminoimidazolesuccinocarboxamide synthase [Thermoactinomyces mirandus]
MNPTTMLYEGKAKQIYATDEPSVVLVRYKDSATAFNGVKKAEIAGKGELNNRISSYFFRLLTEQGIPNHFVKEVSALEQLVRKVSIIPLEVVVRNRTAGSLAKRLGFEEGIILPEPIVEFYYKKDELGDPLVTEDHVLVLDLATKEQLKTLKKTALKVNRFLSQWLEERNLILVDFKLEFGIDEKGEILLADEISPDTCRFWDKDTKERLDKDRFRHDLGRVIESYQEIWNRLEGEKNV